MLSLLAVDPMPSLPLSRSSFLFCGPFTGYSINPGLEIHTKGCDKAMMKWMTLYDSYYGT